MPGNAMNSGYSERSSQELAENELDGRIIQELERLPDLSVSIPEDFSVRVAAKVPKRRESAEVPSTRYGVRLMVASLVILFSVLLVLAARGFGATTMGAIIVWTLCVQFLAIAVWMATRLHRSN